MSRSRYGIFGNNSCIFLILIAVTIQVDGYSPNILPYSGRLIEACVHTRLIYGLVAQAWTLLIISTKLALVTPYSHRHSRAFPIYTRASPWPRVAYFLLKDFPNGPSACKSFEGLGPPEARVNAQNAEDGAEKRCVNESIEKDKKDSPTTSPEDNYLDCHGN